MVTNPFSFTCPPWQAVFFDFDGVIADSTKVKVEAFATMFAAYGPQIQTAVVRYHLANGGMPRHEKLRHCYTVLAQVPMGAHELAEAGSVFAELVLDKVVAAPLMPGVLTTLKRLQQTTTPTFIVSGTPTKEMRVIVARKQLSSYFQEVHGSPQAKSTIVADILHRYDFQAKRCLFVGDALADYRAAIENGVHFLGILSQGQKSIFPPGTPSTSQVDLEGCSFEAG